MRISITVLTAALCLSVCSVALADSASSTTTPSPSQACKALRTQLGKATFAATFGSNANDRNAYGKCVSRATKEQAADGRTAQADCKAEQSDADFATTHDGKTFDQFYGTGKKGKNAYGKCVSGKAKAAAQADKEAVVSAVSACKAERKADAEAFKAKYGTNKNKANAFGMCVSQTAKAEQRA